MLLSAALIVRDEAAHLDGCLSSIRELVDEIVVVDTGSTDDSPRIAAARGAVVEHFTWRDDFSAARNHALDQAHGDWILYIDADERVRTDDVAAVRAALSDADGTVAFRVPFVPRVGWTPYREFRLWRHEAGIRFVNTMHESIVPAISAAAERDGRTIDPIDLFTIEHLGYEGDQARKRRRDEPMLLAAIAEHPDRSFLYDHLARVYEMAGDSERAVATWQRGIDIARARDASHPDDRLVYIGLLFHLLALEQVDDSFSTLVTESAERFPDVPTVELAAARYEFAVGRPRDAIKRLEKLLARDVATMIDTGASYDLRVFNEWGWDLLGLCRFQLGDDEGAAHAFREAERAAPDVTAYSVRRRLAEARVASARVPRASIE
jgi:glycosyltransferase involved in cell wall biosynthesis